MTAPADLDALFARARDGERRAVGRLLSIVEVGGDPADTLAALAHRHIGHAQIIGITGAPGAGKSTLVGALAVRLAARGRRIAVVAIDPSSPVTGGAILGDRIRMDDIVATAHQNIFIRSMATRGQRGGLARGVPGALRALDACGFDVVIVETAGVGQIEIDIVAEADTTVVVLNPGWGDAIQANKAGVMEVADIFVVNKADRPGTDDTVRDIDYMLDLGHKGIDSWRPPIVRTVATDATGIDDLTTALAAHRHELERTDELTQRRARRLDNEVRTHVRAAFEAALETALAAEHDTLDRMHTRTITPAATARVVAKRVLVQPDRTFVSPAADRSTISRQSAG